MGDLINEFFDPDVSVVTPVLTESDTIPNLDTDGRVQERAQSVKEEKTVRQIGDETQEIEFEMEKQPIETSEEVSEEVETPVQTDDKTKTPSDEGNGSSPIPHSLIAKALYEEGVLSSFDEKEFEDLTTELGSPALALIELNKRTITEQIDGYKNSLSEEGKKFLDALEKGVPFEAYADNKSQQLNLATIDEKTLGDHEDLCRELIKSDLAYRGFEDAEITEQLEDIESLGKLEQKGKVALKTLKDFTAKREEQLVKEAEQRRIVNEKAATEHATKLKETVDGIKEMIPGTAVSEKIKKQIIEAITKPAAEAPNGQPVNAIWAKRMENPMEFDIKLAYLLSTGVFDNNWSTLTKAAKTGAVKELETKLQSRQVSKTGQSTTIVSRKQEDILASLRKTIKKKEQ
jgi:hypothetical protein